MAKQADSSGPEESDEKSVEKAAHMEKLARERAELVKSVAAEDFSTLKFRVAAVLNLYPSARDSDIVLTLRYWAMFQPDLYNSAGIAPRDLFKLERESHIVRARAMIQNDYGLFVASEVIRGHRRENERAIKGEILAEPSERPVMRVYADETGKNGQFVMVAAVWVLSGLATFKLSRKIDAWRQESTFAKREMHFARLGKGDAEALSEYLQVVQSENEFLSFKIIGIERAKTRRPIAELVAKLHERMLIRGALHEVISGRVSLPRSIDVTLDEEDSLDEISLAEMKSSVQRELSLHHEGLTVGEMVQSSSRHSSLLQLADLVAGAVNRRRNHEGDRNFKDEFSDLIIDRLGLLVEVGEDDSFDSSTVLPI